MTTRILILPILLFGAVSVIAQDQKTLRPQATQRTELAAYAKSIDQFTRRNARKRRIFGIIPGEEDQPDKWAEFKTVRQAVQANLEESAYVWLRDGKVVAANCSFTSSSGDWFHDVNYYFRADGTLAKIHARLNTFASASGGISVVREKFYSANGKLLHSSIRYLDLKSQRPKQREDFMDQPIPDYKTVLDLPFAKLVRRS